MTTFLLILAFIWLAYLSYRVTYIARILFKTNSIIAKHSDNLQSQVDLLREDVDAVGAQKGRPLLQYGSKWVEDD
jgi:hypothetical protein